MFSTPVAISRTPKKKIVFFFCLPNDISLPHNTQGLGHFKREIEVPDGARDGRAVHDLIEQTILHTMGASLGRPDNAGGAKALQRAIDAVLSRKNRAEKSSDNNNNENNGGPVNLLLLSALLGSAIKAFPSTVPAVDAEALRFVVVVVVVVVADDDVGVCRRLGLRMMIVCSRRRTLVLGVAVLPFDLGCAMMR